MDIFSTDKYESVEQPQPGPFVAVLRTIRELFSKLTGIFEVTKEDLSEAGIYLGGEGRD
jgi:hypothetical protein